DFHVTGVQTCALPICAQTLEASYTLSVTGVRDRSAAGNLIAPGTSLAFSAPASTLPAVLANVAEAADYELIYKVELPSASPRWKIGRASCRERVERAE